MNQAGQLRSCPELLLGPERLCVGLSCPQKAFQGLQDRLADALRLEGMLWCFLWGWSTPSQLPWRPENFREAEIGWMSPALGENASYVFSKGGTLVAPHSPELEQGAWNPVLGGDTSDNFPEGKVLVALSQASSWEGLLPFQVSGQATFWSLHDPKVLHHFQVTWLHERYRRPLLCAWWHFTQNKKIVSFVSSC